MVSLQIVWTLAIFSRRMGRVLGGLSRNFHKKTWPNKKLRLVIFPGVIFSSQH
jgi:hypothetical protein